MRINTELVSTIINYAPSPKTTTDEVAKIVPSSSNENLTARSAKETIFDRLLTDKGTQNIKRWFLDHVNEENILPENQFVNFCNKLTDLSDYEILEIFDIFGKYK
jgi:hypothetical protein